MFDTPAITQTVPSEHAGRTCADCAVYFPDSRQGRAFKYPFPQWVCADCLRVTGYVTPAPDSLDVDVKGVSTHFYVYREHFPFGDYAGYRSTSEPAMFLFWVDGIGALTGPELADYLEAYIAQVSEAGIRQAMTRYADLRAMTAHLA